VSQIDPCATEAGKVVPIWGWPENEVGQPVTERHYFMADGTMVRLGATDAMRGIAVLRARDGKVIREISARNCPSRALAPAPPRSSRSPESLDPFAPPRLLSDIALASETTAEQVDAMWGFPSTNGFGWHGYQLKSGEQLELLFSPVAPFGLVYADLYPAGQAGPGRRIFSNNIRARSRSLDQIGPCPQFTRMLYDLWGPPDEALASGFFRVSYEMSNGDVVIFVAPGDPFQTRILHKSGVEERISCPSPPPFGSR
jgi:hypothetical protein